MQSENIDELLNTIQEMRKYLECTICLCTLSEPHRTRCAHLFCKNCIGTVISKPGRKCPLCKTNLSRRSVSRDECAERCIDQLEKLIVAVQKDTGIDVLSYWKKPKHTKESNSPRSDQPEGEKNRVGNTWNTSTNLTQKKPQGQKNLKESRKPRGRPRGSRIGTRSHRQQQDLEAFFSQPSTSKDTRFGVPFYEETDSASNKNSSSTEAVEKPKLPSDRLLDPATKNTTTCTEVNIVKDQKRNAHSDAEVCLASDIKNKENVTLQDSRQYSEVLPRHKSETFVNKIEKISVSLGRLSEEYNSKPETTTIATGEEININMDSLNNIEEQEDPSKLDKSPPADLLSHSKKNWSEVSIFGKEMRKRGKKMKSLDVSIVSHGRPQHSSDSSKAIQRRELMQEGTNNLTRNDSNKSKSRKYSHIEKNGSDETNEGLPNVKGTYLKEVSTPKKCSEETSLLNTSDRSSGAEGQSVTESSFVTLDEGERVRIKELSNGQMRSIIGFGDATENLMETTPPLKYSTPIKDAIHGLNRRTIAEIIEIPETITVADAKDDGQTCTVSLSPLDLLKNQETSENAFGRQQTSTSHKTPNSRSNKFSAKTSSHHSIAKRNLNEEMMQIGREGTQDSEKIAVVFWKRGKIIPRSRRLRKRCSFIYMRSCRGKDKIISDKSRLLTNYPCPCYPLDANTADDAKDPPAVENIFCSKAEDKLSNTIVSAREKNRSPFANSLNETLKENIASKVTSMAAVEHSEEGKMARSNLRSVSAISDVYQQPPESIDVVFITQSQKSPEKQEQRVKTPVKVTETNQSVQLDNSVSKKSQIVNNVRMLPPECDSQLKFLSLDSPTTGGVQIPRIVQQEDARDNKSNKSSKSDMDEVRGEQSKAFLGKVQASASQPAQSNMGIANKKRKRSCSEENLNPVSKRVVCENEKDVDSDSNFVNISSRVTVVHSTSDSHVSQTPSQGSEEDNRVTKQNTEVLTDLESKSNRRKFRRIVSRSSSSSSLTDCVIVENNNSDSEKRDSCSPVSDKQLQKQRGDIRDIDTDINIIEIANNWCNDDYAKNIYTKRGAVANPFQMSNRNNSQVIRNKSLGTLSTANTSRLGNLDRIPSISKDIASSGKDLFDSEPLSIDKNINYNSAETRDIQEMDIVVEDNDDFNSIIDKVLEIQKADNITTMDKRTTQETDLLHDNFDDVIADVDTEDFICATDKRIDDIVPSSLKRSDKLKSGGSLISHHSSSDKENQKENVDYRRNIIDSNKKSTNMERISQQGKFMKSSSPIGKNVMDSCNFAKDSAEEYQKSEDSIPKDSSNDQDSLMNITQHQMLLNQFEADLFGAAKPQTSPKTPKSKTDKNNHQQSSNFHPKDADQSMEDDDIVQSTPEMKTKNSTSSLNSGARRSVISAESTPISKSHSEVYPGNNTSFTRLRPKNISSSFATKNIIPLHQSTPKSEKNTLISTKYNREAGRLSNTNEVLSTRVNEIDSSSLQKRKDTLHFIWSGLSLVQIERVQELARMLNADYSKQFKPNVTHLIVAVDKETNAPGKTVKYLQCVAHRKWVLGYQWVEECLKQKRLVKEDAFEVLDSTALEAGPRNSRLRESELFEDFTFLCIGPYDNMTPEMYEDLLLATGGKVVDTLQALAADQRKYKIIIFQPDKYEDSITTKWYGQARAVPVADDWIIECISQYKIVSLYPYLQELLPEDVRALGYPEYLVEEVSEIDCDNTETSE